MRRLIKRNRKGAANSQIDSASKTASPDIQTRWAEWMNSRTAKFTRRHWLIALLLFILLAGGYNFYMAYEGLFSKGKNILWSVYSIHKPWFFGQDKVVTTDSLPSLPTTEYERLRSFQLYMDSLSGSPSGKKIYDSILQLRPGLMDSVSFVQEHSRPSVENK